LLDEHGRRLTMRPVVIRLLFDGPAGRFIRTRHAFQRQPARLSIEEQLMSAQTADHLAQPRGNVGPVAGVAGTHDIPPDEIAFTGDPVVTQVKCQLNRDRYLSRKSVLIGRTRVKYYRKNNQPGPAL